MKIPMSAPDIGESERQAVAAVLHTPRLSMGPQVEAFEASMAQYLGARHAIAVSSGTAALHLCVRAAGIQDGDLVITTPFSFVASANVLLYERAIPVFVDVDPRTGNLDPTRVAEAAAGLAGSSAARWLPRLGAERPGELRAVLAVDVFGQPADYRRLEPFAERERLLMLCDAAQAFGAGLNGRITGSIGDAAGPRGGSVSFAYRGFPLEIRAQLFSALEKPGSQRVVRRPEFDQERRGGALSLAWSSFPYEAFR